MYLSLWSTSKEVCYAYSRSDLPQSGISGWSVWFILPFRRKYDVFTTGRFHVYTLYIPFLTWPAELTWGRVDGLSFWEQLIIGYSPMTGIQIFTLQEKAEIENADACCFSRSDAFCRVLHWHILRKKTLQVIHSFWENSTVRRVCKGTKEPSGCWWEMMHGARCTPDFFGQSIEWCDPVKRTYIIVIFAVHSWIHGLWKGLPQCSRRFPIFRNKATCQWQWCTSTLM